MKELNLFERAALHKYRFITVRGVLAVDGLFDMPLQSKDGFNLDDLAHVFNDELQSASKGSFVKNKSSTTHQVLEDKFEIIKRVIEIKQDLAEKAQQRASVLARRREIEAALAERERRDMSERDAEDLRKELAELKNEA